MVSEFGLAMDYDMESDIIHDILGRARDYHDQSNLSCSKSVAKDRRTVFKKYREEIKESLESYNNRYGDAKQIFPHKSDSERRELGRALKYLSELGVIDTYSERGSSITWNLQKVGTDLEAFSNRVDVLGSDENEDYILAIND